MAGNFAKLYSSTRLQIIMAILADGQWHTTLNLAEMSAARGWRNQAVSATVKEIRDNGIAIACRRVKDADQPTWEYRLGNDDQR